MPVDLFTTDGFMKVSIGGQALSPGMSRHLTSVTFKESLDALDAADITIAVPEGSTFLTQFDIYGKDLVVNLMRGTSKIRAFSGDIMNITWSRGGGADREVTLTAVDRLHRLKRGRSDAVADDRRWTGKSLDQIVKDIATTWNLSTAGVTGMDATPDDFEWDKDDATLLVRLAQDYFCTVRLDTPTSGATKGDLVFEKDPGYKTPLPALTYGLHISTINATHSLDSLLKEVTSTGQKTQNDDDPVKHTAAESDVTPLNDVLGVAYLAEFPTFSEKISDESGHRNNQSTVKNRALGRMREAANTFVKGSFDCRFLPEITAGSVVEIKGAGWPLDGKVIVQEVTHAMDGSGYTSKVGFISNSIKRP